MSLCIKLGRGPDDEDSAQPYWRGTSMSVSGIISRALYQTALPAVFQAGASSKTGFGSARGSALGLQDSLVDLYRIGGRLAAKIRQMQRAFEVPFASGRVGGGKVLPDLCFSL